MKKIKLPMEECTGCMACMMSCPTKSINADKNEEGFLYPVINEDTCILCKKCQCVCPILNRHQLSLSEDSYRFIASSKMKKLIKNSASGGIFVTVANYILKQGGVVFGAAVCQDLQVNHIYIESEKDLYKLQNSKYVQSNINDAYIKVKNFLKDTRKVLFSGTPCQVAGLYNFLGKKYSNLYTIDIICHGVPSQKFLDIYLMHEAPRNITGINFRYKNRIFKSPSLFMLTFERKGRVIEARDARNDIYFSSFLKGYCFRESCYKCIYSKTSRIGDITIGDCDSHELYQQFHKYESVSTVLINTNKGKEIWNKVKGFLDYRALNLEKECQKNKQLEKPYKRPDVRNDFYRNIDEQEWDKIQMMFNCNRNIIHSIKSLIFRYASGRFLYWYNYFRSRSKNDKRRI